MTQDDPQLGPDEEPAKVFGKHLGRYELFYRIGTGGMASVYLGRLKGEVGFERWVAVKQIHEHLAEDKAFRDMFLDEARVAVQLSHPNIVQVTDVGVEGERPYLVMEYVQGETLAHILKRCYKLRKRLPTHVAARIIAWACDGLHHAHELRDEHGNPRGLVHRDLSPHNILVSYDGVVKVTDFGIAKAAGRVTHTRTGYIKGKPQYMSPEQALAKELDRRSDVFSLGILLWEATISRRLFKEDSEFETFRRITEGDVPRPRATFRGYPPALESIVMRALSVEPALRQQTARELQQDLERFIVKTGKPIGTGDLSEFMRVLFEDRIKDHEEMLAWARSASTGVPTPPPSLALDHGSGSGTGSSMSLQAPTADERASALRGHGSSAPARRWVRVALLITVLALTVGVGALAVRLLDGGELRANADRGADLIRSSRDPEGLGAAEEPDAGSGPDAVIDGAGDAGPEQAPDEGRPDEGPDEGLDTHADEGPDTHDVSPVEEPDADLNIFPDAADIVFEPDDEDADLGEADGPERQDWPRRPGRRHHRVDRAEPSGDTPAATETGMLSVMARPWCEVYLDGRRIGRTPLMSVDVGAGHHTLLLLPRGERPGVRRTIRVRANGVTPVSVDLREAGGSR